ncbi:MAG TPA: uridine diphosphate-N-acetylglucosamine-binding protein YvcK [Actinomycetota bacterium]|nr:uridine diphosphate-N-acetylglucosamine-binding protein YvcK [Actinomycetota bacterium]
MPSGQTPRIVCVGGGHGLFAALRAARQLSPDVTAVVTVADDGGSSGILRHQLGIPAPGDLRMAVAALAADPEREAVIQYRFKEGELAGHPLGNLLIAALADLRGDFARAVEEVADLAGVVGHVIPSTTAPVRLRADIGGVLVAGQVAIAQGPGAVDRLWLEPEHAMGTPEAIDALEHADLVVLGPGSLFTSVVAALLPEGIVAATTRAQRVALVLNLAEQNGETLGLDGAAHVRGLLSHCPGIRLDAVLVHDGSWARIARPVKVNDAALKAVRAPVVRADLRGPGTAHDPDKLAATLKGLLW